MLLMIRVKTHDFGSASDIAFSCEWLIADGVGG